jgi:hypothetical protein
VYLLRLCRLPPRYSRRLSDTALDLLDAAVAAHLCVGCWVFSATDATGAHMFPRPATAAVAQAGSVLAAAGLADAAGAAALNCTLRTTAAQCANGTAGGACQWNGAGACLPGGPQLGVADPLGAAPRLLNGLVLPYLVTTLAAVAAVTVRHTPLWRVAKRLAACACPGSVSPQPGPGAGRPDYSAAVRDGLFGNIPATYDLQDIPPYDEVPLAPRPPSAGQRRALCRPAAQTAVPQGSTW